MAGCAGKANYRLGFAIGLATQGWARLAGVSNGIRSCERHAMDGVVALWGAAGAEP